MRILVAILCLLALQHSAADGRPVVVGVNHAPPYRVVEPERVGGLYVEIFNALAEQLNWQPQYVEAPFRRILWSMEQGGMDVMLGPIKTPEREAYLDYLVAAFPPERRLFFYSQPENRIERYEDLYGKRIGTLRGSRYFPRFDNDAALKKEAGSNYVQLLSMLVRGHVDVVVAPEFLGLYSLRQADVPALVAPFTVPGEPAWIAVSYGSQLGQYREQLQSALDNMKADGRYQRLVRRYLRTDPVD